MVLTSDSDDDHVYEDSDSEIAIQILRAEDSMEEVDGGNVVLDLEFIAKNIVSLPDSIEIHACVVEEKKKSHDSNELSLDTVTNQPIVVMEDDRSAAADENDESLIEAEYDSEEDDEIKLKPMNVDCLTAEEESNGPSGLPRTRNEIINRDEDFRLSDISACVANMPGLKIDKSGELFVLRAENGSISRHAGSFFEVGIVMNFVEHEKSVIVKSNLGQASSLPLNEDSLVCIQPNRNGANSNAMILGKVSEVFGPVTAPFYLVKLARSAPAGESTEKQPGHGRSQQAKSGNARKHSRSRKSKESNTMDLDAIRACENPAEPSAEPSTLSALEWLQGYSDEEDEPVQQSQGDFSQTSEAAAAVAAVDVAEEALVPWPGSPVFAVAGQCQYLTAAILTTMRVKGSDASNIYDEEPDDSEVEFSDDEKEMLARQSRKNKGSVPFQPALLLPQRQQQRQQCRPKQQNSGRDFSVARHHSFQPPLPPGPPPPFNMMMPTPPHPHPPPPSSFPQFQQHFLPQAYPSINATGHFAATATAPKGLNELTYTYKPIQYNFS